MSIDKNARNAILKISHKNSFGMTRLDIVIIDYDAVDNLIGMRSEATPSNALRSEWKLRWDAENRLQAISDNGCTSYYDYEALVSTFALPR